MTKFNRFTKIAATIAMAALAVLAVTGSASASSIALIKDQNVWLTSPDGSKSYQLTFDGHWSSPSQADNGMVVAAHGTDIVSMDRSGNVLHSVKGMGGTTTTNPAPSADDKFYGPFDPKVSPNGKTVAYWFSEYANSWDSFCSCVRWHIEDYGTSEPVDQFIAGPEYSYRTGTQPSWIDNSHTIVSHSSLDIWTAGGNYKNAQWWYHDQNAIIDDAELSPDRTKLVLTAATNGLASAHDHLYYYDVHGPVWNGEPPYDDLNDPHPGAQPDPRCQNVRDSEASSPTWAPESNQVAYADKDGVWVQQVPGDYGDCSGIAAEKLLVAGASDPDWAPADVNMADKPHGPTGVVAISGLRVSPRKVHSGARAARKHTSKVKFSLTGAGRVTFKVQRVRGKKASNVRGAIVVNGHAGANSVSFKARIGSRKLAKGNYRLFATAGAAPQRTTFKVVR